MEDIILSAWHGGLGDNLQFSTLPELYVKKGHNVYIEGSAYFRNKEIYDFVWGNNPYIEGKRLGERNAGDIPRIKYKNVTGSHIRNWEIAHGFKGENDYPKVYIHPSFIPGYENIILIDVTVISTLYDSDVLRDTILRLKDLYKNKEFCRVRFKKDLNPDKGSSMAFDGKVFDFEVYSDTDLYINNIFEYYEIMNNCAGLISLHTGASHLSSEIKNNRKDEFLSICLIPQWTIDRDIFFFPNIEYIKV